MFSYLYMPCFFIAAMACNYSYSGKMDMSKIGRGIVKIVLNSCRGEHSVSIVLSSCQGGYSVSPAGVAYLQKNYPKENFPSNVFGYKGNKWRTNPQFVEAVRKHSDIISGYKSELNVDYIHKEIFPYPLWSIKNDRGIEEIEINYDKFKSISKEKLTDLRNNYGRVVGSISGLLREDSATNKDEVVAHDRIYFTDKDE